MIRIAYLCTLALGCAATWAQESTTPEPVTATAPAPTPAPPVPGLLRKYYLGLTLGRSQGVNDDPRFDDDTNAGILAGMRLDNRWAVELFYRQFALGADYAEALIGGDATFRPESHFGLSGVYRLSMSDSVSAYGRLGLGKTDFVANRRSLFESDPARADRKSITDPSVGAGMEIGPLWRVGVKLEATRFTKSGVNTYLLGLDVKF